VSDNILHNLQERVKELTALHSTARILQDDSRPSSAVMQDVVLLLPPAWQYPEITVGRISFDGEITLSPKFRETQWGQSAHFVLRNGLSGKIEVFYLEERPTADEGPFLKEERDLIESLAEMLRFYFQHRLADRALRQAHDNLEQQVSLRTEELKLTNAALQQQINDFKAAELRIEKYQSQLRQLASELSLAEARERRAIAGDLHDHIGQALAFIKMNVSEFRGNAMFCGFENKLDDIVGLLDQTIRYTRNLTFEISPPILYELGLEAAVEWLADRIQKKHNLKVKVRIGHAEGAITDDVKIAAFKAIQELVTNCIKHAKAKLVTIDLDRSPSRLSIVVLDDGIGFDPSLISQGAADQDRFGLFNVQERISYLGGTMKVAASRGSGTRVTLEVPLTSEVKHED
jgi:signal transduction histidine kinase